MKSRFALVAVGCGCLAALVPNRLCGAAVTLRDTPNTVALENGVVAMEIQKDNGNLLHFQYGGRDLLGSPAYLDWVGPKDHRFSRARCRVVTDPTKNGGALAEISIEQLADPVSLPLEIEQHFVLRADDPGCYVFVVFHHPATAPEVSIAQSRWVLRVNESVFDFINVDDQRRRVMPPTSTPVKVLGPKESLMFTAGPFKGEITDKYHWFVDAGDHFGHGWSGTKSETGIWLIDGSREDQNGGPTKQHNAAHFGALLLKILTCGHYGAHSVEVAAGQEWSKLYGPWMLYANSGGAPDTLWADAKHQAELARAAWPYDWMRHPLYPNAAERGTVMGRIDLRDGDRRLKLSEAWVGLAAAAPDWQQQSNAYQFWVHPAVNGSFSIPHVRPGEYTLYAFASGVPEEFRLDGIVVNAGARIELGSLAWRAAHFGRTIWQVGTPDRSAEEFRHGDDYRHWGLWQKYPVEFPHDVTFVIGQSKERTDWNYAQVNVADNERWHGTTWQVQFDLPAAPHRGTATLRLALAAAHAAKLELAVNGTTIDRYSVDTDNAMIRAGIHGQYTLRDIPFAAALLKEGRNVLTLEQQNGRNVQPNVMYDCLRLELDESRDFDRQHDQPRVTVGSSGERNAPSAADPDDD